MQLKNFIKLIHERGDNMKFGDKLISLRKNAGMSQEDLASKLNVSRQSVSKWESNNTYPETDKIIQICNIFECRMDDLINDKITDISQCDRSNKNNISVVFDSLLEFIVKSINMFTSLKFKSLVKCIFELGLLGLCLFLVGIVISEVGTNLSINLFRLVPDDIYWNIYGIVNSILEIVVIALGTIIFIHVFKIRYLDYYDKLISLDEKNNDSIKQEDNIEKEPIEEDKKEKRKEKVKFKENEPKIIIRDKHTTFAFLGFVSKIIIGIWKAFIATMSLMFVVSLICLVGIAIFDITLFKYSVLFIGIDLSLLAIIIINILILLVMLNYIINKKSNLKLISCIFLGSLILCGVGVGVSLIGFSSFKFEDSMDGISKDIEKEITISYVDDMVIQTSFDESYKIIIDNSMSNDFIKVVGTNKELYFDKINYSVDKYHGMRSYSFHNSGSLNFSDLINLIYTDLENKTFREYYLTNGDISIVCNSHIANKLINNAKKIYLVDYNKTSYGYEVFDYNQKIFLDYNCEMEYNAAEDSYSCDNECVCEKKVSNTSLGDVIDFNCKYK